ncbi:hypothetical protein H5410_006003 [Solanum commersonii]|uniref:Uncharacterized protein n=1 Tax=Solanum commersonii TaxID=4109 RepID=A0A9J6A8F3_SOLCO|nr:hypothetical protein H5410_006003 [Solanum commersonii]
MDMLRNKYENIFEGSLWNLKILKVILQWSPFIEVDTTELTELLKCLLEHAKNLEKLIIVPAHGHIVSSGVSVLNVEGSKSIVSVKYRGRVPIRKLSPRSEVLMSDLEVGSWVESQESRLKSLGWVSLLKLDPTSGIRVGSCFESQVPISCQVSVWMLGSG